MFSKQCEKILDKKMKIQKETRAKIKILCLELQMIKVYDEKKLSSVHDALENPMKSGKNKNHFVTVSL